MANDRWLKKEKPLLRNVSQSDVRRMQIEKQRQNDVVLDPPQTTLDGLRPPKPPSPAPMRDFHKVANSINREAVPAGMFPGASKKLYDALYMRTRGAVVPVKSIQATRRELSKWSGIKNIKTIAAHLRHLSTVGLLIHGWDQGSTEGSTYEVRMPEEASLRWSKTTLDTLSPSEVDLDQRSVLPLDQKAVLGGLSQTIDNQAASVDPKTSFKTKEEKVDDEAAPLIGLLQQAERELTGKISTNPMQWNELAEVLIAELRIAAARTTVSNVPAFLSEHLRRRLWKLDKKTARVEGRETPDQAVREPSSVPDGQVCPDCSNSGWWYPQGTDKGVARCTHATLMLPRKGK